MLKPWLAQYDSDVPPSLAPYPERTLLDYLDDLAAKHAEKPALLFKGRTVTFGELQAESDAFAAALVGLGVRPRDRVALVLPNAPQFQCETGRVLTEKRPNQRVYKVKLEGGQIWVELPDPAEAPTPDIGATPAFSKRPRAARLARRSGRDSTSPIWIAAWPVPLEPAWTRRISPACSSASASAAQAVL